MKFNEEQRLYTNTMKALTLSKYLYSPNAKSSNLYSNCNNDNIMFAKAVQRAVTIHTAPTLSHPTVKLGFILYNTNCNYNNHRCIFSLYGIKKALRSYHSQRSPIGYSLGGICQFLLDTIVSFCVPSPFIRQLFAKWTLLFLKGPQEEHNL